MVSIDPSEKADFRKIADQLIAALASPSAKEAENVSNALVRYNRDLPKKLFKFRPVNGFTFRSLLENTVWLCSAGNKGPDFNPIRLRWTANNASGSLATFTSRTILLTSSTMQTLVSLTIRPVQQNGPCCASLLEAAN